LALEAPLALDDLLVVDDLEVFEEDFGLSGLVSTSFEPASLGATSLGATSLVVGSLLALLLDLDGEGLALDCEVAFLADVLVVAVFFRLVVFLLDFFGAGAFFLVVFLLDEAAFFRVFFELFFAKGGRSGPSNLAKFLWGLHLAKLARQLNRGV
jgi:hypothetical protein